MTTADDLRRRRAAKTIERLAEEDMTGFARSLERDLPAAPPGMPAPSRAARALAGVLARSAVQAVIAHLEAQPDRRERSLLGSSREERAVVYELQDEPPAVNGSCVLPLTITFCPAIAARITPQLLGERFSALNPERDVLRAQLSMPLLTEVDLWERVAGEDRVPYPFVHDAVRILRRDAAKAGNASLCARCGCALYTRARGAPGVRCGTCAKDRPAAREWPLHALMPHAKGEWWLFCQAAGCTNAFIGSRQARRCPSCRSANVTPRKRSRNSK